MIPKDFNFIYLYGPNTREFDINHALSMISNISVNNPRTVRIFTNDIPRLLGSYDFKRVLNRYPMTVIVSDTNPINAALTKLLGFDPSTTPYMAHLADMYRLYIMYIYGGVYSDVDSIAVNPLPNKFWESDKPIYFPEVYDKLEGPNSLCNGFFLSPPKSQFMLDWLSLYRDYTPEDCQPGTPSWTKFSVQAGWELYLNNLQSITLIDDPRKIEPFYLTYKDTESIFYLNRMIKLKNAYQLHLWETRNRDFLKVIDDEYFNECHSTYGLLGWRYL